MNGWARENIQFKKKILFAYFHKSILFYIKLTQLVGTMYNICKVRGSNSDQYQKKKLEQYDSTKKN